MADISYTVEYAKTGRGKCKGSSELIEKGEMRLGKVTPTSRGGDEPILMTAWFKQLPFFQMMSRMRKKDAQLQSPQDLAGFDELTEADRANLTTLLEQFHDPDVQFPPKEPPKKRKPKAEAEAGDEDIEAKPAPKKKAKAERPPIPDETREGVSGPAELKALAAELVTRCRERALALPPDDDAARKLMGPLVLQCRQGDVVDVGAIIKAAEEQFGVAKVIEVDCEENRGLAGAFSDLSTFNFKNGDTMKGVAFKKVFEALQKHTEPITSGKQAQKLANIGKSSGTKIDEFLSTGRMEALEQFKNAV